MADLKWTLEEWSAARERWSEETDAVHRWCLPGVTRDDALRAILTTHVTDDADLASVAHAIKTERERVLKALSSYLEHEDVTTIAAMNGFAKYLASL